MTSLNRLPQRADGCGEKVLLKEQASRLSSCKIYDFSLFFDDQYRLFKNCGCINRLKTGILKSVSELHCPQVQFKGSKSSPAFYIIIKSLMSQLK